MAKQIQIPTFYVLKTGEFFKLNEYVPGLRKHCKVIAKGQYGPRTYDTPYKNYPLRDYKLLFDKTSDKKWSVGHFEITSVWDNTKSRNDCRSMVDVMDSFDKSETIFLWSTDKWDAVETVVYVFTRLPFNSWDNLKKSSDTKFAKTKKAILNECAYEHDHTKAGVEHLFSRLEYLRKQYKKVKYGLSS